MTFIEDSKMSEDTNGKRGVLGLRTRRSKSQSDESMGAKISESPTLSPKMLSNESEDPEQLVLASIHEDIQFHATGKLLTEYFGYRQQ
jgi:hypothetical protein